jgi:hypothetical protein
VLFEKAPQAVRIACLQEFERSFETAFGVFHGVSVLRR